MEEEILWIGQTELKPNIWGIRSEGGRIQLDVFSRTTGYTRQSPIAVLLFSVILIPLLIISFDSLLFGLGLLIGALAIIFIVYWIIIREWKYYQLVKNTKYRITNKTVQIKSHFWRFTSEVTIPVSRIKQLHLVKYETENAVKTGSIYLYTDKEIIGYNLSKKERTKQAVIEHVLEYDKVIEILNDLMKIMRGKVDNEKR